jgi:hypothetical protein
MSSPSNDWVILKMFRGDASVATTPTYADAIVNETKSDKLDTIPETDKVEVEFKDDIDYDSASTVSTLDEVFDRTDLNEVDKELDQIIHNVEQYVVDVLDNLIRDLDDLQSKLNGWKVKNYNNYFKLFNPDIKIKYEDRYAVDIEPLPDSDARDRITEYYKKFGFDI